MAGQRHRRVSEKIYAASTCLIAASEGEGFGLPLIEAAQHGLPIIARDLPVFREVAGEHIFYFKGLEPAGLATAVAEWLELYEAKSHVQSSRMNWLTWMQSAEMLLARLDVGTSTEDRNQQKVTNRLRSDRGFADELDEE